ncbi:MAG: hypothetical protein C0408_11260, partial [Odoribacter sp.]|nr:hypothetical protein [Odoribacter sp.]
MKRFLSILLLIIITIPVYDACAQPGKKGIASASVLAEGTWFKIAVTGDGIYRIDYSKLKQLGFSNPANPRVFGNNFGQLSYFNNDPKPDDIKEISILLVKGPDGIFNEGDYLLFYGSGTHKWKYKASTGEYNFERHNYSDTAYYFISASPIPGKTIINAPDIVNPADYYSTEYDALYMHEVETENLIKSGREWYQPVSALSGITINPGFSDIIASQKIEYKIRVAGRASIPTLFRLYEGTNMLNGILVPEVYLLSTTGTYAKTEELAGSAFPSSSAPAYEMRFYNNGEQG